MSLIPNVDISTGTKGPWTVDTFHIGSEPTIENLRLMRDGRGIRPGTYTRLMHENRGVVMSDTTAEKADHYHFIRNAKGRCLINGLGIGMCLNAALAKPDVEFVTVIEIDQDLIDLVWPNYADKRCEVIKADAIEYRPEKGVRFGAVWHDIWDSICEDNLPQMHTLHRRYGRRTEWQGSWGRDTIEYHRRQDRNSPWRMFG